MSNILLLGSSSASRRALLEGAQIKFKVVSQSADETLCDWNLALQPLVEQIAVYKMDHVIMPSGNDGDLSFVLTADSLTQDFQGGIHGKPIDRADAMKKLKAVRKGARVGTAFCLDKKIFKAGSWCVEKRIVQFVVATCFFDIPDAWLGKYLDLGRGVGVSGGIRIEGFGFLFLKSVEGSYTTILGLPMFELREALEEIGFY